MARRSDPGLVWGGLGLAAVVGAVMWRQKAAATAPGAAQPQPLSPYPSISSAGYKAPVMTAPGYTPPVVGAAPPPAAAVIVGAGASPVVVSPPAPAVIVGQNAAFEAAVSAGRAMQRDDFARGSADLLARVQAGEISPGSAQYREAFGYLANLTGGVATADAEAAKLTAAGLPPPV